MCPLIGITCHCDEPEQGDYALRFAVNKSYVKAIESAGGAPILIPSVTNEGALRAIYERLDGLLLSGGGNVDPVYYGQRRHEKLRRVEPQRDRMELSLICWALSDDLPILAICRGDELSPRKEGGTTYAQRRGDNSSGVQMLNIAAGGTVYQDIASQAKGAHKHDYYPDYPRNLIVHEVAIEPNTKLAMILGCSSLGVNSLHHQAVRDVAPGFIVNARASDGIIEGLESSRHRFVLGLQFHPEELCEDNAGMRRLFEAFVAEAAVTNSLAQ